MSTSSLNYGPLLVSDLPPAVALKPTMLTRLAGSVRTGLAGRRESRAFERALRFASPDEAGDLLAARRRA